MPDQPPALVARYAASFREGDNPAVAGALILEEDQLRLEGSRLAGDCRLSVPYGELTQVRIGRAPSERLNGRNTVVLSRRQGAALLVAPLGMGLLHELTDLIASCAARQGKHEERLTILVPLKPGSSERVRELIAEGPPFDPAGLHLTQHQVFLSPEEAVFVLEGMGVAETFARVIRDPALWRAGIAWKNSIAGRPRLVAAPPGNGELVYTWTAQAEQT